MFQRQSDLQAIYERLTRTAIHTVKPDNIATFLGRKLMACAKTWSESLPKMG